MPPTTPLLQIKNLSKIYHRGRTVTQALNDVSLDIHVGQVIGLLGVNGAGKTTLSRIIATLHPPTSGSVSYCGESIYDDLSSYRRAIGFCPQKHNLDTQLTVEENLLFAGRYLLMPEAAIHARITELAQQLDFVQHLSRDIDELSGGTQQRVLIARALIHSPKLLILDEPTVGLDPDIRQNLWQLIKDLKKSGLAIVLTTHYLDEAEELSDQICILHHGSIVLNTTLAQLKSAHEEQKLERIFLKIVNEYRKAST